MQHSVSGALGLSLPSLRGRAAAAVLAVAGGLLQPAAAMPPGGPAAHHGAMAATGGVGGLVMAHPRQLERLFDGIGATAEQRAQIRQIADAARAELRAQREAGAPLHDQAQTLFAQPTVDEAAVEALRRQMLARHDEASKRWMQALLDMSRVLTPEQRQALAERLAQRREMMQRQRAEREAGAGSGR